MRFQREKMRDKLQAHLPTNKLSRRAYFKEMMQSKICISPFGLGEITLNDFECFLTGSMLLKPDMSHMRTWPNFYEDGKTCMMHDWDLYTLEEKIDYALSNEKERIEIAQAGQDRFIKHTIGPDAAALFVSHFEEIFKRLGR